MLVVAKELSTVGPSRSVKYARGAKSLALMRMEGYAERFLTLSIVRQAECASYRRKSI